jgi:hypothetical protein
MSLYQRRMDKCTTEQFWIVALLGGMNGFIIAQKEALTSAVGVPALVVAVVCASLVGIVFVLSRHSIYRHYDRMLAPHLDEVSRRVARSKLMRAGRFAVRMSGVILYVLVIVVSGTANILVLRM